MEKMSVEINLGLLFYEREPLPKLPFSVDRALVLSRLFDMWCRLFSILFLPHVQYIYIILYRKNYKEVTKHRKYRFFLLFLLDDERSRIRIFA
jgi:hypothetical protein